MSKLLELIKCKKHPIINLLIIFTVSVFISNIIEYLYLNKDIIKYNNALKNYKCDVIDVNISDLIYKDYKINNNLFISTSDDPWFTQENVNMFISTIKIIFHNPLKESINISIYYSTKSSGLTENNVKTVYVQKGETVAYFDIYKDVDILRYDIGNKPDVEFELSSIILNEGKNYINYSKKSIYKIIFLFFIIFFILIHIIINIKLFYDYIFKYRYIVAIVIFAILVINKIHFSSVGMFEYIIQPGLGTEFNKPIIGKPKLIRSDEWFVSTPIVLASQFAEKPYGKYTNVLRGTRTDNNPLGIYINFATISNPLKLFFLLGPEYGLSASWIGILLITFMVLFEFMYIISKNNRLLAVTGSCLITFSPFFLWWSYTVFITTGIGTLVCFYYYINSEKIIKKILLAIGVLIFFTLFILSLYPPWQVPSGYLFLGLAIWIIKEKWENIMKFNKFDWIIISSILILIFLVILAHLSASKEYIKSITNTVYPGARNDSGGNLSINYLLNRMMNGGLFSPISAYKTFSNTNISSFGGFWTLFPIPILFTLFIMIKNKKYDLLSIILILYSIIIGSYVFIGWPDWLAKITLMSQSTSYRAIDVVLLVQVILLITSLSRLKDENIRKRSYYDFYLFLFSVLISLLLVTFASNNAKTTFIEPISSYYFIFIFIGLALVTYSIFNFKQNKKIFISACLYLIILSIANGYVFFPVMKGLDVIYSKPLSKKIKELSVNINEKWISLGSRWGTSQYLIANGASTINSVNFYPNLELWYKLDPERKYEFIYNRFAHIVIEFTTKDTSYEMVHEDHFKLNLSYEDLIKTNVKYISTPYVLYDYENIKFNLLYDEGGSMIYEVKYEL